MKLTLSGITIDVNPADADRYLRAGYAKAIEKPVERPANIETVTKKAKAGKEKQINGDT